MGAHRLRVGVNALASLGALVQTLSVIRHTIASHPLGVDLQPVLRAARAVSTGHGSVYQDREFVYLPTVAVLFSPFSASDSFFKTMAVLELSAVLAGIVLLARGALRTPWWPAIAALVAVLVMRSTLVTSSAYLENLGMIVGLLVAAAAVSMGRGRWGTACFFLALSLLVKPVAAPLLVVPLLAKRWRPLLGCVAGTLAVVFASMAVAPGSGLSVLARRLWGTPPESVLPPSQNLTLESLGRLHQVTPVLVTSGRVLVVIAVVLAAFAVYRRQAWSDDAVPTVYALVLGVFLAGTYYELSYVFVVAPLAVGAVLLWEQRRPAALLLALGTAIVFLPEPRLGGSASTLSIAWCAGSLVSLLALTIALAGPARYRSATPLGRERPAGGALSQSEAAPAS